ncbi:rhomboid family intramembrane serine protease [Halomonas stenophila]|uniref:Membrane associated rhomboid family serine protease n=1 Tax=Halomonas stenophila TaxID=795312 RepID=A0A7W5EVT3_9GAMM|nr:rhomboid family intramembrane serine protease [Halomonas stenophila]MBB3232397.1 membrane associated rhomboid family serine protease [Halomonas stenophila]
MRREREGPEWGERRGPSVIGLLLLVNGLAFLAQLAMPGPMFRYLALWPLGAPPEALPLPVGMPTGEFHLWQLLSYAFLHGSLFHLAINMFVLWMFGSPLERDWGSQRFALYYFLCVLAAGAVQLMVASMGQYAPTVGASGGIYALLLAFGMRYPNQYILLLIPPIPMKAKYFVVVIGLVELWFGIAGTRQGVAHFAHLAGMVAGLVLMLAWRQRPRPPSSRWRN